MERNPENYPGLLKNLKSYFAEYCKNTSLHGLKFLGEKHRNVIEKLWWIIVLGISFYFCSGFIVSTYQKWKRSPVIVNFATSQTPIWQIPYPAVTICPETKSNRSIFNYAEMCLRQRNNTLNKTENELYEYMSLICLNKQRLHMEFVDEKFLDFITEVAPDLKDTLWLCKWMGKYENCSTYFIPIITETGVCFSFNILNHKEMFAEDVYQYKDFQSTQNIFGWLPESGYSKDDEFTAYPRRALFSGTHAGLSLTLETVVSDIDELCSAGIQGYKVHLHHPADVPSIGQNYFRVPLDESVIVAIKPRMMETNEKLISYPPDQRKCYFAEEKPLRFFNMYSQQNCHTECLTNFTLNTCKCVAFYMPHVNSTPICGAGKKNCLFYAEAMFLTNEVSKKLKLFSDDIPENDLNIKESCECLPSCASTDYDGELSQSTWEWRKYYDSEFRDRFIKKRTHNSKLTLFFKERQIMTSQRNELYGPTDFIANCGGILGLFVGFSFISLAELIYFLTLRFMMNLRTYGRHFWAGDLEIEKHK